MKIATSHPNLKQKSTDRKFTKNEFKFLQFMEEDEDLESFIKSARERANIPPGGFDLNIPLARYLESGEFNKMNLNKVHDQADLIYSILYGHLPKYWVITLIYIIVFNIALPPARIEMEPIKAEFNDNDIKIIIRRNISRKEIVDFLTKNKTELDKHLSGLSKNPTMPQIKAQDLDFFKKIRKLKEEGNSDFEIASKIDEESDFSSELDPAKITVYRNRFNKYKRKYLDFDRRSRIVQEALKQALDRYRVDPLKK